VTAVGPSLGQTLYYSTYLGGDGNDAGKGIAVGPGIQQTAVGTSTPIADNNTTYYPDSVYVTGSAGKWTTKLFYTSPGALQTAFQGGATDTDAFAVPGTATLATRGE